MGILQEFEAALITDGSASYAVLIHYCPGDWSGGIMGWAVACSVYYTSHINCYNCNHEELYRLDGSECTNGKTSRQLSIQLACPHHLQIIYFPHFYYITT